MNYLRSKKLWPWSSALSSSTLMTKTTTTRSPVAPPPPWSLFQTWKATRSPYSSPSARNISRSRPITLTTRKIWSSTSKSCWKTWCLKNSPNLYSPRTTSTSRRPWISSAGPWLVQSRTRVSSMFASSLVWRVISSRERRRNFARSLLGLLRV